MLDDSKLKPDWECITVHQASAGRFLEEPTENLLSSSPPVGCSSLRVTGSPTGP